MLNKHENTAQIINKVVIKVQINVISVTLSVIKKKLKIIEFNWRKMTKGGFECNSNVAIIDNQCRD